MAKGKHKIKLPKSLLKELGLKAGDTIQVRVDKDGNGVVVTGKPSPRLEGALREALRPYTDKEWEELLKAVEECHVWQSRDDTADVEAYLKRVRGSTRERMKRLGLW